MSHSPVDNEVVCFYQSPETLPCQFDTENVTASQSQHQIFTIVCRVEATIYSRTGAIDQNGVYEMNSIKNLRLQGEPKIC